jgi:hypothetical protein
MNSIRSPEGFGIGFSGAGLGPGRSRTSGQGAVRGVSSHVTGSVASDGRTLEFLSLADRVDLRQCGSGSGGRSRDVQIVHFVVHPAASG